MSLRGLLRRAAGMGRLELGERVRGMWRDLRSERGWDLGHWEGLGAAVPDQRPASMAMEEWGRTGASLSPLTGEIGREESIKNEPPGPRDAPEAALGAGWEQDEDT